MFETTVTFGDLMVIGIDGPSGVAGMVTVSAKSIMV
jgi:hypothetical protein